MAYDFDEIADRSGTNSIKYDRMPIPESDKIRGDVIPLWVADMDFLTPEPVLDALRARVEKGCFGYTALDPELSRSAARWYARRFEWEVPEADILYCPGLVPALGILLDLLTEPGDGVLIQRPVYHPFANLIASHGRTLLDAPLVEAEGGYRMDFRALEEAVSGGRATLAILCSPHNPVGRVWTAEELREYGRICLGAGIPVIADEIHHDLLRRGVSHVPFEKLFPERRSRIVTLTAPSKTFNLAGLQLSNVIVHDPELKARWTELVDRRLDIGLPNAFAAAAARAAWDSCESWLEELTDYLDANFAYLADFLARRMPRARLAPAQGTYLAWVDFRACGLPAAELAAFVLNKARVFANDGAMFGPQGAGFLRLNLACPRATLAKALERIAAAFEGRGA